MNLSYSQVLQILFVSLVWVWERRWYVPPFSRLLVLSLSLCWKADLRGGSVVKNLPAGAGYAGSIPGSGRFPGEGNGYPLQYSCLESSMDRGVWRAYSPWCHQELDTTERFREMLEEAQWWKWLGNFIIGSEGTSPADSASCLSSIPASSSLSQAACWARGYCEKNFCKESLQVTLPKPWAQKSTATSLGWKTSACLGNIGSLLGVECGFVCTLWTGVGACWWAWGHHVWVTVRLSL